MAQTETSPITPTPYEQMRSAATAAAMTARSMASALDNFHAAETHCHVAWKNLQYWHLNDTCTSEDLRAAYDRACESKDLAWEIFCDAYIAHVNAMAELEKHNL